jgi:Tfp pilus assembly protein PilF
MKKKSEISQSNTIITNRTKNIEDNINSFNLLINRAITYFSAGDIENALKDFDVVIEKSPANHFRAYLERGKMYMSIYSKIMSPFMERISRAFAENRLFDEANIRESFINEVNTNRYLLENAISDIVNAEKLNNNDNEVKYCIELITKSKEKIENLQKNIGIIFDDANTVEEISIKKAIAYYSDGKIDIAIEKISKLIADSKNNLEAYLTRGQIYSELYEKFFKEFLAQNEINDDNISLPNIKNMYSKLISLINNKQYLYKNAVEDFENALKLDKDNEVVKSWYKSIIEIGDNIKYFLQNIINTLSKYDINNYNELSIERAFVYLKNGEFEEALTDINKIIKNESKNGEAYLSRAKININKVSNKFDTHFKSFDFDDDKYLATHNIQLLSTVVSFNELVSHDIEDIMADIEIAEKLDNNLDELDICKEFVIGYKNNIIQILSNIGALEKRQAQLERSKMTQSMRYDVLKRDNFKCKICGRSVKDGIQLHVDHIIPISKGGKTEMNNLQILCNMCNFGKSDKL